MRISIVNFIYLLSLTFFLFTNLSAHDCCYSEEHKLEAYIEFNTSNLLSKSNFFHTALQEGDVPAIYTQMSADVNWNGQSVFPYPLGDPHFNISDLAEILFNKINQNWTNC